MSTRHAVAETLLDGITIVASDETGTDSIVGIYFPRHWTMPPADTIGERVELSSDPLLTAAAKQLDEYLAGERRDFELPIALIGDPFQQSVWAMLQEIPFGETVTYGELAERLGNKSLAQMVGQAVGHNPISIVVACHRVVGSNGKLTGYAGGLERKQFLLELEEPELAKAERLF